MDVPEIPADLITLEQRRTAALEELLTYSDGTSAQRRAEFPDPEQIVERQTWTPEQSARLGELRAAYTAAAEAVRRHPVMVQALEERRHHATELALREAAKKAAAEV